MKQNLTIVIVTHNSSHIIKFCLDKINFSKHKVVVVDNASSDDTVGLIRQNFPQAQILQLPKNIGYGRGNNVALKQMETEFALILNPDCIIFEKDIDLVLTQMIENSRIALAGPMILDNHPLDEEELKNKIEAIERDFATIKDRYYQKTDGNFLAKFLIGAALFMRISIFKEIGFFDEKIFLYYEDDELCSRVLAHQYQNVLVSNAVAFHLGNQSSQVCLRMTYKKSWHLTWSKLYWKKFKKGNLRAKKSAFKFVFVYLSKSLFFAAQFNSEKFALNFGAFCGAFASLIGLESFDKNGNSRG